MSTMECGCVCDMEYDSAPCGFQATRHVKARKTHTCCECGEAIKPGDIYERVSGMWYGDFSTIKTCAICARIRIAYCCNWLHGELREALWECLGLDYISGKTIDDEEEVQ